MPLREFMIAALSATMLASVGHAATTHKPVHHAASPSPRIAQTGVLARSDLVGIALLAAKERHKDQFSDSTTNAYAGRSFIVVQRVAPDDSSEYGEENAKWNYDRDAQTISFKLSSSSNIEVFYKQQNTGTFVGQNAFGVKKMIHRLSATTVTISGLDKPKSGPNIYDDYVVTVPVQSGDEARRLSRTVVLVVEGNLAKSDGAVASCDSSTDTATMDVPNEFINFDCSMSAKIDTIEFLDPITHKTLAQWPGMPPPPAKSDDPEVKAEIATRPSAEVMLALYPQQARREEQSGRAVIQCTIEVTGQKSGCRIITEEPDLYGFGDSSLIAVQQMTFRPAIHNGMPVESRIEIPLNWTLNGQ